ncbi:hypothetical protein [Tropicimonas sediminicola]|uniref:Uncharacterized protein n=1 Tax=Tropicimonas sediminicola TaxID=1031541 RepID=A0A239IN12_9RHOB|nr:hypothetical protein [Tropicimonas sediminicola]SNS94453.1 hypothetical protein SAMN05421757_104450 [Tropicimonas sediminicola]
MFRFVFVLTVAAALWSSPSAAYFAFEMPHLSFPSEEQGSSAPVTRGAGSVVTQATPGQ